MATYKYTGVGKDGSKVNGVVNGYSEMDAIEKIRETCSVVTKVTEVKESKKNSLLSMEIGGNKLNMRAFTVMCSQFSIILTAGIPMARTIQLIADKTNDKPLKKLLNQVSEDVEAGRSMASSFSEHGKKMLPPIFIETIRAGEESGNVEAAFDNMYKHFDKQSKLAGKVKGALSYPIFVFVLAIIVVIVLMVKVVLTFTSIFDEMGAELPLMTRMLIAISNFFAKFWWLIALLAGSLVLVYNVLMRTEEGKIKLAKLALKIPVLGDIQNLNSASQFSNNLATLLAAGLPITKAISITSRVIDNYYISTEVGKSAARLEEGKKMGDSLKESACLPDILIDMVAVGEETGELEKTLGNIAGYYDAELEMAVSKAISKLEPTVLVFIAGIGGFVVIAIYMAMFSMYGNM